ncbi:MAG TPA: amidohydrolase [Candidatus Polarisedimenticolaceae bacterium]|nr:amidohydrolase [Candidatus Polarisedimenticolaceae bacterium]
MSADPLRERADSLAPTLVGWRRELHRHPELSCEEHRTAAFVAERLRELGLEVRTAVAGTGVVGLLRAAAATRRGPAVLLRADMDALPIQEVAGREYGSSVPGRMHACGHDGHMAMLLGAAGLLAERRAELERDVVLCFQPAEEAGGGAQRMLEAGVLELVETGPAYALHLWSAYPAGTFHVRPGPTMAAQDEFRARVVGVGGHGAFPHTAVDPIVAAAQAVTLLQGVVARSIDPIAAAVVTVGAFHAGTAANVIPGAADIAGTLRSFTPEVRQRLRERVREVLEGVARAAGCRLEYELLAGYPAVVNDERATSLLREVATGVFGAAHVHEPPPMAGAEDFAYFLERRPGAFAFLGAGNVARGITAPHHSPEFDIDESVLPRGAELLTRLALRADHPC